jgi:hypothetical protein
MVGTIEIRNGLTPGLKLYQVQQLLCQNNAYLFQRFSISDLRP